MKTKQLLKNIGVLILLIFTNCQNESETIAEEIINEIPQQQVEELRFDEINSNIKSFFNQPTIRQSIQNANLTQDQNQNTNTLFGEIKPDRVIKRNFESGYTNYTIALKKLKNDFYFDNALLIEAPDGSIKSAIIRYRPTLDWYQVTKGVSNRFSSYSGSIEVFSIDGTSYGMKSFVDGQLQSFIQPSISSFNLGDAVEMGSEEQAADCDLVDVGFVGGCVIDCFYDEIILYIDCPDSDGGSNPPADNGNPNPPGDTDTTGGGGGGSGGATTDPLIDDDGNVIEGPSCESFNFQIFPSLDYQVAFVKNINFKFYLNRNNYSVRVNFPQAIEFGLPYRNHRGDIISTGIAAELSAEALQTSISETFRNFKNHPAATELQIRLYFEERLKHNYPIMTLGGRVRFNPTVVGNNVTEYKIEKSGTGNCQ